ncbi:hypothetical protein [Aeromicrobium sp. CTD01-1L150]|uniref:hypothetical protein n=1 Tax=Aeromicrobium sp. CTD01-1L150 TaxID=3341830 RepID=UPI0035C12764
MADEQEGQSQDAHGPDTSRYTEYLVTNRDFTSPAVAAAVSAIDLSHLDGAHRILDAGTRAGGALPALAALASTGAGPGRPVLAIDREEAALDLAGGYARDNNVDDLIELRVADLVEVAEDPYGHGGPFGLIWASDVVWPATFEDPAGVVSALSEALVPGGILALFTTNYYQSMFLPGHGRLERLIRTASERTWGLPMDGKTHHERLGAWLGEAGLEHVELRVLPVSTASVATDPAALAYLQRIVWPEMRHAVQVSGRRAGMGDTDLTRVEKLLDPDEPEWVGNDPHTYVVQPTMLWTGRRGTA